MALKTVRVVPNTNSKNVPTVNITATNPGNVQTCLQALNVANPTIIPTVQAAASVIKGLKTIFIAGYSGIVPMPLWTAAKAARAAGTRNAKIACVGDSTTAGFGAYVGWTGGRPFIWPARLAVLMGNTSAVSIFGDQNIPQTSPPVSNAALTNVALFDDRLVFGSGWLGDETTASGTSYGAGQFHNDTTVNAMAFRPDAAFDTIDFWYPTNAGLGTIVVNIDGGATILTLTGAGANGFAKATVSVALGVHTINVARSAGTAYLCAIVPYVAANKEISIYTGGWSSGAIDHWIGATNAFSPLNALKALAPDLTIICLTINSWFNAAPVPQFKINTQVLIDAAKLSGDVILMSGAPSNSATTPVATQQLYVDAYQELATSNRLNFINMTARWGSFAAANANGFMYDNLHPSPAGYADIATAVSSYLGAPAPVLPAITVPSGLVGYWPLDGETTVPPNTNDIVGGQTGVMTGSPLFVVGKVARGLSLDGSTKYVRCGNGAYLSAWSVCAWVNPASFAGYNIIVMRGDSSSQNYYMDIRQTSGLIAVGFTSAPGVYQTLVSLAAVGLSAWNHVVGTFDGATLRVYRNGVLDTSAANALVPENNNGIGIGTYGAGTAANFFNGIEDDIRIYNRALSGAEITSIYNAGLAGNR